MVSDPMPSRSARSTAAGKTRSLLSGIRGCALVSEWVDISIDLVRALTVQGKSRAPRSIGTHRYHATVLTRGKIVPAG
jgi:hypothetical protein